MSPAVDTRPFSFCLYWLIYLGNGHSHLPLLIVLESHASKIFGTYNSVSLSRMGQFHTTPDIASIFQRVAIAVHIYMYIYTVYQCWFVCMLGLHLTVYWTFPTTKDLLHAESPLLTHLPSCFELGPLITLIIFFVAAFHNYSICSVESLFIYLFIYLFICLFMSFF